MMKKHTNKILFLLLCTCLSPISWSVSVENLSDNQIKYNIISTLKQVLHFTEQEQIAIIPGSKLCISTCKKNKKLSQEHLNNLESELESRYELERDYEHFSVNEIVIYIKCLLEKLLYENGYSTWYSRTPKLIDEFINNKNFSSIFMQNEDINLQREKYKIYNKLSEVNTRLDLIYILYLTKKLMSFSESDDSEIAHHAKQYLPSLISALSDISGKKFFRIKDIKSTGESNIINFDEIFIRCCDEILNAYCHFDKITVSDIDKLLAFEISNNLNAYALRSYLMNLMSKDTMNLVLPEYLIRAIPALVHEEQITERKLLLKNAKKEDRDTTNNNSSYEKTKKIIQDCINDLEVDVEMTHSTIDEGIENSDQELSDSEDFDLEDQQRDEFREKYHSDLIKLWKLDFEFLLDEEVQKRKQIVSKQLLRAQTRENDNPKNYINQLQEQLAILEQELEKRESVRLSSMTTESKTTESNFTYWPNKLSTKSLYRVGRYSSRR